MGIKELLFGKKPKKELPPPPIPRDFPGEFKPKEVVERPELPLWKPEGPTPEMPRVERVPLPPPRWEKPVRPKPGRPLFVKLEKYDEAVDEVDALKGLIVDIRDGVSKIEGILTDLKNTLKKWESMVSEFEYRLSRIEALITGERAPKKKE